MFVKIMIELAGYVAEKKFLGSDKISTHCKNDLKKATNICYMMVRQFGMEESKYGLIVSDNSQVSQTDNAKIDRLVQDILNVSLFD